MKSQSAEAIIVEFHSMKRNLERLADELFDILVVGGGIHGAAIVREAACSRV